MSNYINPPFNFTGSKFKLLPQLLPHFDYSKKNFIDLFCGGGSVYCNVLDKYEKVWVNDIIRDLIHIHENLISDSENFIRFVKNSCPDKNDKESYIALRDFYNKSPSPDRLFALILSCTNNMMRFNKSFKFNQTFGKRSWNNKTQEKADNFIKSVFPYKDKINYSSKEFYEIWPDNPKDTFFYLDPPYLNSEAGYNAYWSLDKESRLYNYILKIHESGGSFCLSGISGQHKDLNTSFVITSLIKDGFDLVELDYDYKKVARNKDEIRAKEIIIKNY